MMGQSMPVEALRRVGAGLVDRVPAVQDPRVIALLCFVAIVATILVVWSTARKLAGVDPELEERLKRIAGASRRSDALSILRADELELSGLRGGSVNRWLHEVGLFHRIRRYLSQAGSPMGAGEFLTFTVLLATLAGVSTYYAGWSDARSLLIAGIAALIPPLWMMRRRSQRMAAFSAQVPDALELMAGSLRAGHAYSSAVHVVGEEMADPIASEFRTMAEEYRVGLPHRECLERLLMRVDHPDLHLFAVSVLIQTETGGNLAEVLEGLAETVRARSKMQGKVRAITAEGRLSGVVLAALPVVVGIILSLLNPGYLDPLLKEPIGHLAIAIALTLQVIGFFWIRKIVRVGQ